MTINSLWVYTLWVYITGIWNSILLFPNSIFKGIHALNSFFFLNHSYPVFFIQ